MEMQRRAPQTAPADSAASLGYLPAELIGRCLDFLSSKESLLSLRCVSRGWHDCTAGFAQSYAAAEDSSTIITAIEEDGVDRLRFLDVDVCSTKVMDELCTYLAEEAKNITSLSCAAPNTNGMSSRYWLTEPSYPPAVPASVWNITTLRHMSVSYMPIMAQPQGKYPPLVSLEVEGLGGSQLDCLSCLTHLTQLSVSNCTRSSSMQGLKHLTRLQQLAFKNCNNVVIPVALQGYPLTGLYVDSLPVLQSVTSLQTVTELSLVSHKHLLHLKESIPLDMLQQAPVLGYPSLSIIPVMSKGFTLPRLLRIEVTGAEGTTTLYSGVKSLPAFTSLQRLNADASGGDYPQWTWDCTALRQLKLKAGLQEHLPASMFEHLVHLTELEIEGDGLTTLPCSLGACSALQKLCLVGNKLRHLPDHVFQQTTNLGVLDVDCPRLSSIPPSLRATLIIRGRTASNRLSSIFSDGETLALARLELHDCMFTALPEDVGALSCLQALVIQGCNSLGGGCNGRVGPDVLCCLSVMTKLTELVIADCASLAGVIDMAQLLHLQRLTLDNVPYLVCLPERALNQMTTLRYIHIHNAGACLNTLDTTLFNTGLAHLALDGGAAAQRLRPAVTSRIRTHEPKTTDLQCLPGVKGRQPLLHLASLELASFSRLQDISGLKLSASCTSLASLALVNLRALKRIPDGVGQLGSLTSLQIEGCGVKTLPDVTGLTSLHMMKLVNCWQLQALPGNFGQGLTALQELQLEDCPLLKSLPGTLGQATALAHLRIVACNNLTAIYGDWQGVKGLQSVIISSVGCKRLVQQTGGVDSPSRRLHVLTVMPGVLQRFIAAAKAPEKKMDVELQAEGSFSDDELTDW